MFVRITAPVVLLSGLLLAHIWTGDFGASSHRLHKKSIDEPKENFFRCVIDNDLWESDSLTAEVIRYNNLTTVYLRSGTRPDKLAFIFKGGLARGVYALDDPSSAYAHVSRQNGQCLFTTDEYYQGMLMIDHLDEATNHLKGSFELLAYSDECRKVIRIHNGRFNVKFFEREIR